MFTHNVANPPNVKILKKARKYIHAFLYEQDHGPFEVQSATWKNFAVAWLTPPGALKEKDAGKCNVSCITLTIPRVASNFKTYINALVVKYGHVKH